MTPSVERDGDQLIATRHLHAEPALVWEAFTTPSHLVAFWGGHHATVPPDSVTVDLRVGGTFELETRGADGSSHSLRFRYEVVDPPTRQVPRQQIHPENDVPRERDQTGLQRKREANKQGDREKPDHLGLPLLAGGGGQDPDAA